MGMGMEDEDVITWRPPVQFLLGSTFCGRMRALNLPNRTGLRYSQRRMILPISETFYDRYTEMDVRRRGTP